MLIVRERIAPAAHDAELVLPLELRHKMRLRTRPTGSSISLGDHSSLIRLTWVATAAAKMVVSTPSS